MATRKTEYLVLDDVGQYSGGDSPQIATEKQWQRIAANIRAGGEDVGPGDINDFLVPLETWCRQNDAQCLLTCTGINRHSAAAVNRLIRSFEETARILAGRAGLEV